MYHISKVVELIFKGELNSLQGCFRKQIGREDRQEKTDRKSMLLPQRRGSCKV